MGGGGGGGGRKRERGEKENKRKREKEREKEKELNHCSIAPTPPPDPSSLPENQVIILSPTRELAKQTHQVLSELGDYIEGLTTRVLVGGSGVRDDIRALRQGVQIVVGTPGRVAHMIADGHLRTDDTKLFVLDEADEMLQVGFWYRERSL